MVLERRKNIYHSLVPNYPNNELKFQKTHSIKRGEEVRPQNRRIAYFDF